MRCPKCYNFTAEEIGEDKYKCTECGHVFEDKPRSEKKGKW